MMGGADEKQLGPWEPQGSLELDVLDGPSLGHGHAVPWTESFSGSVTVHQKARD